MATRRRIFKKYLIAMAGLSGAAVTFQTLNPNSPPSSTNSPFINGIIRSSRALLTITSSVVDYKYSLYGFNPDSDEYRLALSKAVPCQFEAIKDVLLRNLGPNFSEIFFSFDEQPVAAASIAQVHHAVLKDHQEVAVKVQYPGLEYQMKFDLATMSFLSKSVELLFPEYRFQWLVSEFEKSIASELENLTNSSAETRVV